MVLFDIIGSIGGWIRDRVYDVVNYVTNIFSSSEYDDNLVEDVVNVEKVLAEFRDNLRKKANEVENRYIDEGMAHFDQFAREVSAKFPDLEEVVQDAKESTRKKLNHSIVDYAHEHISENDPGFKAILEMQPGPKKKNALDNRMKTILNKAEINFRSRLKQDLKNLFKDLNKRITDRLNVQEKLLQDELREYEELEKQAKAGTLDLGKIEVECIPVIEASYCVRYILEHTEENVS